MLAVKRRPIERAPTSPGDHLREFLTLTSMTQEEFARALQVSRLTVNELVNNRRAITPDMAVRLEEFTTVSAETWLDIQLRHDLWNTRKRWSKNAELLDAAKRIRTARRKWTR